VSRATGYEWWSRWRAEKPAGLTGRARHIPRRTLPAEAQQIEKAHRGHTVLGGHPLISRVNNPAGHYS
jgi:hypothetical protein